MHLLVSAGGRCCDGNVICVGRVLFAAAAALQEAVICCAQHRHAQSCRATCHVSMMLCVSITLEDLALCGVNCIVGTVPLELLDQVLPS